MNAEEGTSMAKMAVSVLLVVLIIGAVVGIVYAAYSWFTSGTNQLSETVNGITQSMFSQYDNQVVKGSDVLAALKSYRDTDVAVLISNLDKTTGSVQGGYASAYDSTSNTLSNDIGAMNYCSLVTGAKSTTDPTAGNPYVQISVAGSSEPASIAGQYFVQNVQYDATSGLTARNTNFSPTTTSSNSKQYVKTSASFYSVLVYSSSTGDVCGILFLQQN